MTVAEKLIGGMIGFDDQKINNGITEPTVKQACPFQFVTAHGAPEPASGNEPMNAGEGIRRQTTRCIEVLQSILEEAGGGLENLVEVTTYLTNMNDYAGYNDIYSNYFPPDGPARTTIAVERLESAGAVIGMRGVAYISGSFGQVETNPRRK